MIEKVYDFNQLSRLVLILSGYKSISECDIGLGKLNVLIGANGAGKSNFIGFFRPINRIPDQQLQATVGTAGGQDARRTTRMQKNSLYPARLTPACPQTRD